MVAQRLSSKPKYPETAQKDSNSSNRFVVLINDEEQGVDDVISGDIVDRFKDVNMIIFKILIIFIIFATRLK